MIDGRSFNIEWFKDEPLDKEIENLVYLINQVDGVETTDSCFGHHKMPCRIWVRIKNVDIANSFVKRFFYLDPIWSLKLTFFEVDDYADELLFVIESAYQDYPTVDLMVENLTKRFEERINNTEITNALNDKSEQEKWIPINKQTPNIHNYTKEYLVTNTCNDVSTAFFTETDGKSWWSIDNVIAWQEKPKPYKGESEPQKRNEKE